jgi:hypothetical protein
MERVEAAARPLGEHTYGRPAITDRGYQRRLAVLMTSVRLLRYLLPDLAGLDHDHEDHARYGVAGVRRLVA